MTPETEEVLDILKEYDRLKEINRELVDICEMLRENSYGMPMGILEKLHDVISKAEWEENETT